MKKHWINTQNNHTPENVAEDAQKFIELQTGLCVGYQVENGYVTFLSWYNGVKFEVSIDSDDTDLLNIQKYLYDYCKSWNNGTTDGHAEREEINNLTSDIYA